MKFDELLNPVDASQKWKALDINNPDNKHVFARAKAPDDMQIVGGWIGVNIPQGTEIVVTKVEKDPYYKQFGAYFILNGEECWSPLADFRQRFVRSEEFDAKVHERELNWFKDLKD